MKLLLLLTGWSALACGSVVSSFTPDAYTLTSTVSSDTCGRGDPGYCYGGASGGGIFAISFSGFDQIFPRDFPYQIFRLDVPVIEYIDGYGPSYAGGDITVNGHFLQGVHAGQTFDLEYLIPISSMQQFLLPLDIVEHVSAESRYVCCWYHEPTSATASVTVRFDQLRLYAFPGVDVSSLVTWDVTQSIPEPVTQSIPEPATALLAAAALGLGLVVRRR